MKFVTTLERGAGPPGVSLLCRGKFATVFEIFQGGFQFTQHHFGATDLFFEIDGGFDFQSGGRHR